MRLTVNHRAYPRRKRVWYYAPWTLTNPLWPPVWRGGDEYDRKTVVIQPPLLGALVIAFERKDLPA